MEKVRRHMVMPEDWEDRMVALQEQSKVMENTSKINRFEVDDQQIHIASNAKWTEYRTKNALFARISEVKKMRKTLEQYLTSTKAEYVLLNEKLNYCENIEDDLVPLQDAITRCLQIRDEKTSGEVLNDNAHKELMKTGLLIKDLLNCLQNTSLECRTQAESLHKCAFDLDSAIDRQDDALKVDQSQLALEWTSPGVSHKPTPATSAPQMMAKPIWESYLKDMLENTDKCLEKSRGLRGEAAANLNVIKMELQKQKEAIEFSLRQIIHAEEQVIQQLQWQEKYLIDELKKCGQSVDEMEKFKIDGMKPFKVAQTRMANRSERPPLELCYDDAQHSLKHQINFWNETHDFLHHQLSRSRLVVHQLEEQLANVSQELSIKRMTLELDKRCLEASQQFKLFQSSSKYKPPQMHGSAYNTPEKFWQRALLEN